MQNELYSDGIGEITVTGSVVRVDLMSLSATERDVNDNPKSVLRQRVILSVEAFANSVDLMQKALKGLVDAGVVRRNLPPHSAGTMSGQPGDATVPHEGSTRTAQPAKASPNFG